MANIFREFGQKVKKSLAEETKRRKLQFKEELEKRKQLRIKKKEKFNIIKQMTINELNKVAKNFISAKPMVIDIDPKGNQIQRKPKRFELEDALLRRVALKNIFFIIPRLDPNKRKGIRKKQFKKRKTKKKSKIKGPKSLRILLE